MAEHALKLGVHVQTHTPVTAVQRDESNSAGHLTVVTERGNVSCDKVVYCTNAWTGQLLPELEPCVKPVLNTVFASQPAPRMASLLRESSRRTGQDLHPGP